MGRPHRVPGSAGTRGVRRVSPGPSRTGSSPCPRPRRGSRPPPPPSTPARRPVPRDQRLLQRVRGVLAVADRAQRHRPEPVPVPPDELGERVPVAVDVGAQQSPVIGGWLRLHGLHPIRRGPPRTAYPFTETVISWTWTMYWPWSVVGGSLLIQTIR